MAIVTPDGAYGRINDVNILYLIWSLGYQGIWGVFIPQKLFDLIYPERKNSPLIGTLGFILSFLILIGSCYVEWFTWTQIAYPAYNNTTPYQPATSYIVYGFMFIALLVYFGYINKKKFS